LRYLAERAGEVVTREKLEREVWGFRPGVRSEAVPVTIRRLRGKIEPVPEQPSILLTVQGRGWRLVAPPTLRRTGPPGFATPFVPRAELALAAAWLASGHRLVTLVGPGGAGKTRLAAELARAEPGSVYADLVRCDDEVAVTGAVIEAIGAAGTYTVDELPLLVARERLVVLDHAEVAAAGVARVASAIVHRAPGVRLVVASRVALGVPGEVVLPVGGLDEPSALALVAARVAAAGGPPPTPDRVRALRAAVDGSALALELCARPLAELPSGATTAEIVARIDRSAGGRGGLAASVAWSRAALSDDDRDLLGRCAVFPGGFDVGGARRVLGSGAEAGLERLRRGWLVHRVGDRYHVPQVTRDALPPPDATTADAHAAWVAHEVVGLMDGFDHDPARACDRARELRDDLERVVAAGPPEVAARAALCLYTWAGFDGPREVARWLHRVPGPLPPRLAAELALARAGLALSEGERDAVASLGQVLPWPDLEARRRVACLAAACETGDPDQATRWLPVAPPGAELPADLWCDVHRWTGTAARLASDLAGADRAWAEGHALSVRARLPACQALFLAIRSALVIRLGDPARGLRMAARAVELGTACRRPIAAVVGLLHLRLGWIEADPSRAAACAARAAELSTTVPGWVLAAFAQGMGRYLAGDADGALEAVAPWVDHLGRLGAPSAASCRLTHAAILAATGDTEGARRGFDAVDPAHVMRVHPGASVDEARQLVAALRTELDRAEGRRGDTDAAARAARQLAEIAAWTARQPTLQIRLLRAVLRARG
ncbi:MAG: winged helix-turn-helix domain-containing protein, partial [Myxococcota bacterium]